MPYNSQADLVCLFAERYDTKSNVKLSGFQSQLHVSYVSSHTEELWFNETVCLWMKIYISVYMCVYVCIYEYMCVCVCVCVCVYHIIWVCE